MTIVYQRVTIIQQFKPQQFEFKYLKTRYLDKVISYQERTRTSILPSVAVCSSFELLSNLI
jgi:hypothetical protein